MKKLLKPAGILLNFLSLPVFFIIGMYFAGFIEAGKNQGLAGGAIVFGWGVLFAGLAFILSLIASYQLEHKKIIQINWILFILLIIGYGTTHYRFLQREKIQKEKNVPYDKESKTPTKEAEALGMLHLKKRTISKKIPSHLVNERTLGMGYFSPNYFENPALYFYGNLNLEKSIDEYSPIDSISFKRNKYNQFEIATAPPWLAPEILKLDYDLLYFKVESTTLEFVEVVVNKYTQQTYFVNRQAGSLMYWPDFLLSMHSVEFFPESNEKVRARSFENSSEIATEYEYLRPLKIKGEWMEVKLMDVEFKNLGTGWIQWKRDNQLLVIYNLLS